MSARPEQERTQTEGTGAKDKPTGDGPPALASREDVPEMLKKLQDRKQRHKERSRIYRVGNVVVGLVLVVGGIVLSGPGVPGPGFLVILLGLGLLALEFERAERVLGRVIIWADKAKGRVNRATTGEKIAAAIVAALVVGGLVAAALLWDIPLLPV